MIEDFHATGDEVVGEIAQSTPPGLLNRIMGMQNIKGTGLDFVYRWLAWEQCERLCQAVHSPLESEARQALQQLAAFQEFGLLCEQRVVTTLEWVHAQSWAQREESQVAIQRTHKRVSETMAEIRGEIGSVRGEAKWWERAVNIVEAFLDAGDAVSRRRRADQINRDIADERISLERAALELQRLTNRQKGGWLIKRLRRQSPSLTA